LTTSMLASEREDNHCSVHHVEVYAWTQEWKSNHLL
jgi:hypothetical protein